MVQFFILYLFALTSAIARKTQISVFQVPFILTKTSWKDITLFYELDKEA